MINKHTFIAGLPQGQIDTANIRKELTTITETNFREFERLKHSRFLSSCSKTPLQGFSIFVFTMSYNFQILKGHLF